MTSRFQVPLGIWWGLEKDFSNWLSVCSQKEFSFSCSLYLWFIDTTPHFIYCSEAAAVSQTRTQPLGREDRLEKGTATHSSILNWRIPRTGEPGTLQSKGLQTVRYD